MVSFEKNQTLTFAIRVFIEEFRFPKSSRESIGPGVFEATSRHQCDERRNTSSV